MTHELPYSGLAYEIGSYDPDELNFESASGSIASFDNGAEDVPLKSLIVNIVPIQSGTGDPSPSNVRPITGWDEVEVYRTGVNIWDEEWENGYVNGTTGATVSHAGFICSKNFIPVMPNTTYKFVIVGTTSRFEMYGFGLDKSAKGSVSNYLVNGTTFTTGSDVYFVKFNSYTSGAETSYIHPISINYPSTDAEYHPYQGTSYPISLPSTVYGGELNVTSGVLTISHKLITFDGSESWGFTASSDRNRVNKSISGVPQGSYSLDIMGNYIKPTTQPDSLPPIWSANINNLGGLLIGVPITITSADDWKTYLANNPLQVVYPLAEPQTVQLTPTEVTTLLGNNNIYSSCGDVEVEFIPMIEKNTFPYSGAKYYVGVFEETEPLGMVRPIDITPISIDEPIISPIDLEPLEPIEFNPIPIDEPIDEPIDDIEDIEEEETETEESETDGECESELND